MKCIAVVSLLSLFLIAGCKDETTVNQPQPPPVAAGFPGTVGELLGSNCLSCHNADAPAAGLRLDSWSEMIKGSDFGEAVIPFDSENSVLIEMVTKLVGGPHPAEQSAGTLTEADVDTLIAWIENGARNDGGVIPYAGSTDLLYVCSQDADIISIIDVSAMVVIRNIDLADLGYAAGSKPHHIAVEPDGQYWYASLITGGRVLKFDSNNQMVAESGNIPIPALLALNTAQNTLYVSRFMDLSNVTESIYVLDRATMQGATAGDGEILVPFPIPHAMAISHSGAWAYTASLSQNQVIFINTTTNEAEDFLPIGSGKGPLQFAVSPDDNTLYLSCQLSHEMLVIDPSARAVVATIPVDMSPWHPTFTPDGGHVYVGNFGADVVTDINTATRTVEATVSGNGISQPHGIAASSNSPYVFVSNRNVSGNYVPRNDFGDNANIGTVAVINTTTNLIEKVIEIEEFGSGMAIRQQ